MTFSKFLEARAIYARTDLIALVRKGIEMKQLHKIQAFTALTDAELASLLPISQRQLARYADDHILNKDITSHLIQLIELFQKGHGLFGEDKFGLWIRTENKTLSHHTPLSLMDTSVGIKMVGDIIGRIEHGVFS